MFCGVFEYLLSPLLDKIIEEGDIIVFEGELLSLHLHALKRLSVILLNPNEILGYNQRNGKRIREIIFLKDRPNLMECNNDDSRTFFISPR